MMGGCIYRGIHAEKTASGGWVVYQTINGIWLPGEFPALTDVISVIDRLKLPKAGTGSEAKQGIILAPEPVKHRRPARQRALDTAICILISGLAAFLCLTAAGVL